MTEENDNSQQALTVTPETAAREKSARIAQITLSPSAQAALIIRDYSDFDGLQFRELAQGLDKAMQPIHEGDFSQVESLMFSQAVALDTIFGHLCRKALTTPGYGALCQYLELGLKAQRQSRNTLEALRGYRTVATTPAATVAVQINNANGAPEQAKPTNEL